MKKLTGSVRFYKSETEKTEPKQKKPSQTKKTKPKLKKPSQTRKTELNRFEPVFVLKTPNRTGRFELVSVFFIKTIWFDYFFYIKTKPNQNNYLYFE